MLLLLITFAPLLILLIWGRKLNDNLKLALSVMSLPFFILVAFYSLIVALGIILAYIIYMRFILPYLVKRQLNEEEEFPPIDWRN